MDCSSDSDNSSQRIFDFNSSSKTVSNACTTPITSNTSAENLESAKQLIDENYIAVVGGLGYIGSHTCLELLKSGHNILIIDNLCNSFVSNFDKICLLAKDYHESRGQKVPLINFCEADYRDETKIKQLFNKYMIVDTDFDNYTKTKSRILGVIHFAAHKSVSESIENPFKYYANNVSGLIEFCAVLKSFNIKTLIFSSSATVYGAVATSGISVLREEYCVHQSETFVDHQGTILTHESGCTGLTNPYGRSKWMCEAILSDISLADDDWSIMALRYFNPIGCDESGLLGECSRGAPSNLMPVIMQVLSGKSRVLKIFGADYPNTPDGTAIRDYIHVTDLARGHISALAAARKKHGFRTYNLGSGIGYSVRDIIQAVEEVSCKKIPVQIAPRRVGDVERCVALPQRAENELKWKAKISLKDACRDSIKFMKLEEERNRATA
ncbi:unnamed protein product [Blumeria hordei]|uniref:NAD-dependent epimerase/dehydratase domain-containing protein n=1 Tax=Blumeria hordei TaxID=2867405 RepID=A0A383UMT6_BLUHO|nr:unnamed protein product [Blumeria hordei]